MELTILVLALLVCTSEGHESHNIFDTGVQTFAAPRNDSEAGVAEEAPTSTKPPPQTYTVVDWKRFYPFGDKFPDSNRTNATDSPAAEEREIVLPVYIRVPIRVPVKASFRRTRTVPGGRSYPRRYPRPRYSLLRHLPTRRKFITFYGKPSFRKRYIKPLYHKTGIHDLYKKNVYYKARGRGYEVKEPEAFDSRNNLI